MFCREEGIHPGSISPSHAAVDGTEPFANSVYENCATGPVYVPEAAWFGAQYLTKTY